MYYYAIRSFKCVLLHSVKSALSTSLFFLPIFFIHTYLYCIFLYSNHFICFAFSYFDSFRAFWFEPNTYMVEAMSRFSIGEIACEGSQFGSFQSMYSHFLNIFFSRARAYGYFLCARELAQCICFAFVLKRRKSRPVPNAGSSGLIAFLINLQTLKQYSIITSGAIENGNLPNGHLKFWLTPHK